MPGERKTRYTARLAQSENYGIAFSLTTPLQDTEHALALRDADHALVGEDSREILKDRRYRTDMDRTALIDLVMGHLSAAANDQVFLDQKRHDKHALKSRLFADEAEVVLRRKGLDAIKGSKPHIHVIGAMAGTHAALIARGFDVTAADMSPDVVGQNLGGVTVCDGTENRRLIETADLVIITGMTLPNRTLPHLIETAKTIQHLDNDLGGHGQEFRTLLYRAWHRLRHFGSAPFLMLPGPSSIGIWRREH